MMMPRMDGLTLAREIKARADLPIIVLSAIDAGDSKADLLEEVAEDYVTKPYHYPELRARINRVLRRLGDKVPRQSLVLGPSLTLDLHRREATVGGETVQLTPTESRLLYALAANLGKTVTTETLLARGWAETEDADPSYVWVTMRRLRQKVEVDPNKPVHVQTVRGVGYRLIATATPGRRARRPTRDGRRWLTRRPPTTSQHGTAIGRPDADRRPARRSRAGGARPREAERASRRCPSTPTSTPTPARSPAAASGSGVHLSFRTRLTLGLVAASVLPLAGFGIVVLLMHDFATTTDTLGRLLLLVLVLAALVGILLSYLLAADLIGPLRAIATSVDRVSAGDLSTPISVPGDDELARLADSHNRLAATLERRNRELGRILAAIEQRLAP